LKILSETFASSSDNNLPSAPRIELFGPFEPDIAPGGVKAGFAVPCANFRN
jgi:hypothetical protein